MLLRHIYLFMLASVAHLQLCFGAYFSWLSILVVWGKNGDLFVWGVHTPVCRFEVLQ